jgi:hypothetical protein
MTGQNSTGSEMPLEAAQMAHFPSLARLRPPRIIRTVAWLIVLGIALAIAILFVPWLQTAEGRGQVDPQRRRPRPAGLLAGERARRGILRAGWRFRQKGDPIVRVVDVDPDLLDRLAGEKAQVEAQIAAVEQARSTAAIDVARTLQLYREGWPPAATTNRR